jgi:PAS domain S-box-containing protein
MSDPEKLPTETLPVQELETEHSIESLEHLRERVANMVLKVLAVIILVPLAGSLYRMTVTGWQPVMLLHVLVTISIYTVYIFRGRLPFFFKSWFLVFLFMLVGIAGLLNFGAFAAGLYLMTFGAVMTTGLIGQRVGLAIFVISALCIVAAAVAYLSGALAYPFDPETLQKSPAVWVNLFTGFILANALILAVVGVMNKSFIGSIDSLRHHERELEEEMAERERTQSELAVSERNYREIFDATTDAIFVHDIDTGAIINVNQGMLEMFGYTMDEVKGLHVGDLSAGTAPYSQEEARQWMDKSCTEGPQRFEWLSKKKDGEMFWAEVNLKCAEIGDEERVLASVRDISLAKNTENDLRKSLTEKEVLLREVHHRVKSNLQSITGLLTLQASHDPEETVQKALRDSRLRIRTMALVHETLYQSEDLTSLDMRDFVTRLVNNLAITHGADPDRITIKVEMEEMSINMDTAVPVGLIINELVSNALFHAFPSHSKGQVRVSLNTVGGRRFSLVVSDNGIGLPQGFDLAKSESLGLQLVNILGDQLGSGIEVNSEKGTRFSLEFDEYFEAGSELY